MDIHRNIEKLIGENVWIPIAALGLGIFLLKISDSSVLRKLAGLLPTVLSGNFISYALTCLGLVLIIGSFGLFLIWIKAYNKKRLAKREKIMRQAAGEMGWNYDEYQKSGLTPHLNNYRQCRILGLEPGSVCTNLMISNILSRTIGGDLFIIFDSELTESGQGSEKHTFIHTETVFLVISDRLDLPYFQTRPEIWPGDHAVTNLLKNKAGIEDLKISHRPDFSAKYILLGTDRQNIERVLTPPVIDFYVQNSLYRTIGDGKMFCLSQTQIETDHQLQITHQQQILQQLFQLLKN